MKARYPFRSYEKARYFVRRLKLKGYEEWLKYKDGKLRGKPKLPHDIPKAPSVVYGGRKGWVSWIDFLGNKKSFLPYREARKMVMKAGIKSQRQYMEWTKDDLQGVRSKFHGKGLPSRPSVVYKRKGWKGWGVFLGTGVTEAGEKPFLSYRKAKKFIKPLKISNARDYRGWAKGEVKKKKKFPQDLLPKRPDASYMGRGWKGWDDFLSRKS